MKKADYDGMTVDQLWALHLVISKKLSEKLIAEKRLLERRLGELKPTVSSEPRARKRRPYPPVFPKFFNPEDRSQTWAGRGKRPRWLTEQLKSGRHLDDFRIQQAPLRHKPVKRI
jgi:DNA-binding protein H-NS